MKELLTKNIGLKLLSFLLAALLWVIIMNINDPYITVTISNIRVDKLNENAIEDKNKMFEVESGEYVSVTVRGPRSVVDTLKASGFKATADLKQMSIVNAVPIDVRLDSATAKKISSEDIQIISKSPEMMLLTLEDAGEATFRVDVVTIGDVRAGYYIADKTVNPNMISVTGSQKQIARISQVVVKVNVTEVNETIVQTSVPVAYDENHFVVDSSKVTYETEGVEVTVTVLPTKEITLKATQQGEPFFGYECTDLQNLPLTMTIAGSADDLEKIGSYFLIPFDVSDLRETKSETFDFSKMLEEAYPDNNFIVVNEDKNVLIKAKIEKLESKEMWIKTSSIAFHNLPSGLDARFKTEGEVKVKLIGLPDVLEAVTEEDLKPYIDLTGTGTGMRYLTVSSDTRANVKVTSSTIGVEIFAKTPD